MDHYEAINLDDYIRSGEGGTAVSYKHKTRDTLVKLYNAGFEADRARAEFLTARTVFELGIPTPKPYRLVTDGERYGAEYEFVPEKRSFSRIISEEPGRLEEISLEFARMSRLLHGIMADPSRLRSFKQVLPAYLGTGNGPMLDAYSKRLLPFYAVKVPYVYEMAYHGPLSEEGFSKLQYAL